MKSRTSIVVAVALALGLAGCGSNMNGKGILAPARALTQPQEDLLKKLEALPPDQRRAVANANARQIIAFSKESSIFGQRIDTDLGLGSAGKK